MTLTGFLPARIAEDEAVAREAIAQRNDEIASGAYIEGHEPKPDAGPPTVWDDWIGGPGIRVGAEWLLAECEAKRLMLARVERAWALAEEWQAWADHNEDAPASRHLARASRELHAALADLAL